MSVDGETELGLSLGGAQLTGPRLTETAALAEELGYRSIWSSEAWGQDAFTPLAFIAAATESIGIGTAIAQIAARTPAATAMTALTLQALSGGRLLLGLGVSHVPLVEVRKHAYGKPLATMRAYLRGMAEADYRGIAPPAPPKTVLAALGPKMLELSAELADGAHPYNVPPEHTRQARRILGAGKLLCVEQAAILETNAADARAIARRFLAFYFGLPNYVDNWRRLGFTDPDFAGGGSDRLIDAIIAWGDEKAIRARIQEHWQAGADQVCVQAVGPTLLPDERLLALLAPR